MLRLHDYLTSGNGYKVRLLLAQLGAPLPAASSTTSTSARRARPSSSRKNPNGRIPLLELDDGTFLRRVERDPLLPGRGHAVSARRTASARAEVLQWMFFEQYSHEPNIATVRFWLTHQRRR